MDIEGDENLVLNHEGLKVIGLEFMDSLNAELKDKGLKGEIRLLKKEGSFRGGFILEKNGIEINNTYEALISSLRDELEFEVAKVLFS
jgi:V/A-type H+-transporting ATPase subunit E